jgi:N-acetyl-anhydromuramyl-L-alanine amidase AmpD
MDIPFVQARWYTVVASRDIDLVVIHDMEAPEKANTAEAVARYFARTDTKVSAHYCITPETRILTGDLRWTPASDLVPGDHLVAVDEFHRNARGRRYQQGQVEAVRRRSAPCLAVTLEDGRVLTSSIDHWWLTQLGGAKWEWVAMDALQVGDRIAVPLTPWSSYRDDDLAWLAGLLDGEGCLHRQSFELTFSQAEGPVMDRALEILDSHDIRCRVTWRVPAKSHHRKIGVVCISGIQANLELLGRSRPVRFIERAAELLDGRFLGSRTHDGRLAVVNIQDVGEQEVVSMRTSTRTFLANGAVSHNCIDNDSIVQCVRDSNVAWHAPGANHNGIGLEHAGYASQRLEDWRDAYSTAELQLSAQLARELCDRYRIPVAFVDAADLRRRRRGITTHWEVSKAFRKTDHTDPGPNFPMDDYLAMVRDGAPDPTPVEPPAQGDRPVVNAPVVGILSHASWGGGYIEVGADGGMFSHDAPNYGSTGDMDLNASVVGGAPTPSGQGYWLVASDGGVFPFGDAAFYGSTGNLTLNAPVVGMTPTGSGQGYWLAARDGGVFSFGDAEFKGSVEYRGQ